MNGVLVQTNRSGGRKAEPEPSWVAHVRREKCRGCHDDFYNYGGPNANGKTYCFSMQAKFARLKGKPPCYH